MGRRPEAEFGRDVTFLPAYDGLSTVDNVSVLEDKWLLAIITAVGGFCAGVATDWLKHWNANWFTRHNLRNALKAELSAVIVSLNFFVREAIEHPERDGPAPFGWQYELPAFDYYWTQNREALLKLPEWSRLRGWRERLLGINDWPEPRVFSAIMLVEALLLPPMDKLVTRPMRQTIRLLLSEPRVQKYKSTYFRKRLDVASPGTQEKSN